MKCREFDDLIDRYLAGDLSETRQEAVEMHYFSCHHCFLKLQIRDQLHRKRIAIRVKEKKPVPILKPLLVLTSLFIAVFSTLLIINVIHEETLIQNITSFDPPRYIKTNARDTSEPGPNRKNIEAALSLYNRKEFARSLHILDRIKNDETNPQIIFFKGINHLFLSKYRQAVAFFNTIIDGMDPAYYDDALYYKGMALLKLRKTKAAKRQFHNLAQMFSPRTAEAKAILKKMAEL